MSSPTKLDAIVTQNSPLRQLFREAEQRGACNEQIIACIDRRSRPHVCFALVRDETLIIVAESPAWAAKLRYQIGQIRENLDELPGFPYFGSIRVKVKSQHDARPQSKRLLTTPISESAAGQVREHADMIEDEGLKNALLRLANPSKTPLSDE